MKITIKHLRAAKMCNREPRMWFKAHGLSWNEFLTDGIEESVLRETNDPLAMKVIEAARRAEQSS